MSRFEDEARRELEKSDAYSRWVKARVDTIHDKVSAVDVLRDHGVSLRYGGNKPEQISCPFHGTDTHPSARFHPGEGRSSAGVWCFVCNKRWDAIGLWKGFNQFEGSFGSLLRSIERSYGIDVPDVPPEGNAEEAIDDPELPQLFDACEHRLRGAKRAFTMQSFLTLSSLLERLYHRVEKGAVGAREAKDLLRKMLDKIGAKERECPDG